MKLLRNNRIVWVYRLDDRGREESQTLYRDVVEKEDERSPQYHRIEDTAERLLPVQLIQDLVLADTFGLDQKSVVVLYIPGCLPEFKLYCGMHLPQ